MKDLKLWRINMVTARLAEITKNEKWKESEVESEKSCERGKFPPNLWIQSARDPGPPIMQSAHEPRDHPADHEEMKMGDDEIGVVHMDIDRERGEKKSG